MSKIKNPEDADFQKLSELSPIVFKNLQNQSPDKQVTMEQAILLSIFGVFDPENKGLSTEQVTEYYNAYVRWLQKKISLN